jgi:hypothetical protein
MWLTAGIVDTGGAPRVANIFEFSKNSKLRSDIYYRPGKLIHKEPAVKHFVTLSL